MVDKHKEMVWNIHNHDSLLENKVDENLTEEERKAAARTDLQKATTSRAVEDLRAAIEAGEGAGLDDGELEDARTALGEEERKIAARSALQKAAGARAIDELHAAIEKGTAAGLDEVELADARTALAEEER